MKGKKMLAICAVLVAAMLLSNANNISKKTLVKETHKNKLPTPIPVFATPADLQLQIKPTRESFKRFYIPTDIQITLNEGADQNPAITTDGSANILCLYEIETDINQFDIGIGVSYDGGANWPEGYYFEVDGNPEQPRLDFYEGKTAYGTWTADPIEAFGYAYYAEFPDITDPEAGEYGWVYYRVGWGESYGIGAPFTSSDVACYAMATPPTPDFWGIVAFTGDNQYSGYEEDNAFMFQYATEEGYVTIIFFYNMSVDVFNVSVDIDQSTGWCVMVADFIDEKDPSVFGSYLLAKKITSSEDWWRGGWNGAKFKNCMHPYVDAKDGRFYIATEFLNDDGSTDIVCWTSSTPSNAASWKGYYVTETPGENERYPAVTAINANESTVLYTKDGNVYSAKTNDGGKTWEIEQVNDNPSTVYEGYGCLDVEGSYGVWTDTFNGNNDIFFDIVGRAAVLQLAISGGFGAKVKIANIGNAPAKNVKWSIDLEGKLVLIGKHKEGIISEIQPGVSVTVSTGLVLGIGKVNIKAKAGDASATATAFLLGPFVLGVS
ncbi:MAG: hypothetical protein QXW78_01415 [Candidatus Thermoplasmatota archaeon]